MDFLFKIIYVKFEFIEHLIPIYGIITCYYKVLFNLNYIHDCNFFTNQCMVIIPQTSNR